MVFRDGKLLFGKRKAAIGFDQYGTPGGHLEHLESFEDCARRECREEAGIEIERPRFLCLVNNQASLPHHFIMTVLVTDWKSGEPRNLEPDKCAGWDWYALDELPPNLTYAGQAAVEALHTGQAYFDWQSVNTTA